MHFTMLHFTAHVIFSILCHSIFFMGSSPPRSTPWGVYRSAISYEAIPLSSSLSMQPSFKHSLMADRSMVVGHIPTVHTFFYVNQSHSYNSTHLCLLMSQEALWESLVCLYDLSHSRTRQVSITSFSSHHNVSQMVTHPSTNWAHGCLTSVIGLWMVAPCQWGS